MLKAVKNVQIQNVDLLSVVSIKLNKECVYD